MSINDCKINRYKQRHIITNLQRYVFLLIYAAFGLYFYAFGPCRLCNICTRIIDNTFKIITKLSNINYD